MEFVDVAEAKQRSGLRMVVVPGIPSPWGEAAKGIFHVKQIPFVAVKHEPGHAELAEWTGASNAPVVMLDDEPPRSGWAEILLLAERLTPEPALIPDEPGPRAAMFGFAHEICGEMGLGWCRRLEGIAAGLEGRGGFPKGVAAYLAPRYGYREGVGAEAHRRVLDVLGMLSRRLLAQQEAASDYFLESELTALDIYSATFVGLLKPLPPEQCPMPDFMRTAMGSLDDETRQALDPVLIEHRDRIYQKHLKLPLEL